MKIIQHHVFMESVAYPVWARDASARRERNRERVRQKVEAFINDIGVDTVLSVVEHAPTFGRFSIVIWWYREIAEMDPPVMRASQENQNA